MNRLWLALHAFWRILTEPDFAAQLEPFLQTVPSTATAGPDLRVLTLLQRDGRLIDFLQEDIDPYTDAQIGAAVRDIHRGCRKALRDYMTIEPVLSAAEEERITIASGYDPAAIRLIGNVNGSPPFSGVLKHHGWRVKEAHLPSLPATRGDTSVLSPAEVEVL